jgi:hypothetical protein
MTNEKEIKLHWKPRLKKLFLEEDNYLRTDCNSSPLSYRLRMKHPRFSGLPLMFISKLGWQLPGLPFL